MQTIQEAGELGGALSRSVTSMGGVNCASLMAAVIPADKFSALGRGKTSGGGMSEHAPRPRHNKSSTR
jgi:hypothetical protein